MNYYHVHSSTISVVRPAIDHTNYRPRNHEDIYTVTVKYNIIKPYILFVGNLEPRKNISTLIKAYDQLPGKLKGQYSLVLAGSEGWNDEGIKADITKAKKNKLDIIITGYISDDDLPGLYSGASLFVYPTLYEGFGMPVVEAMACGVPVITSDNSSMPEAGGDAAIFVDATDTNNITKQIERVLGDKKLVEIMVKKGIAHAKQFSWEESAKNLKKVIDQVLAK